VSRWLKIALAVSVALNLFAAAAAVTVATTHARVEKQVEDQGGRDRRGGPGVWAALNTLDPAVRERVKQAMRGHALAARPDFEAARTARRQAIDLASQPSFDPADVQALLEQSRLAELRGRARLERGAVEVLGTVQPAERKALAPVMLRQGPRFRDRREERKAPAPQP
jgi:uncharacterized membrane protein